MAKVQQFYNKNQFIIDTEKEITFQSYDSTIATINKKTGVLTFGKDWDYSHTTRKHLYLFLQEYEWNIEKYTYSKIFYGGFDYSKNKRAFLQNLIDNKTIKVKNI